MIELVCEVASIVGGGSGRQLDQHAFPVIDHVGAVRAHTSSHPTFPAADVLSYALQLVATSGEKLCK